MIVLHVDTERTWRGGEQQIDYLVAGLELRGHRSVVVANPGAEISRRFADAGREVIPVRMRGELDPAAIVGLARAIGRIGPDVVHLHTAHAHTLGVAAARLVGRARRVVSRRVDFEIGPLSARLKYRSGVDRFIAITSAVAAVLERAGVARERISVVPSGIDARRLADADRSRGRAALELPPHGVVVGTVAHLAWHKGLVHLIRAFAASGTAAGGGKLVIVGQGEDEALLRRTALEAGAGESIRFAGFRSDVADCIAAFDCFVLPSVLEGLGTSILDALALGVPVVASRTGGIPEIVRDEETGLLVPPGDELALAAAIDRMLGEKDLAERTAEVGRRLVLERFTADAMVEGTLAAYAACATR